MKYTAFFSNEGLTSTSANHICNLAREYAATVDRELAGINLMSEFVTIIGGESAETKIGSQSGVLCSISDKLKVIADCNALIAWLREAIKAKDKYFELAKGEEYLSAYYGIKYDGPDAPMQERTLEKEDVIGSWDIKKRNRYLEVQARASVIGKFIHPDGVFAGKRDDYMKKLSEPTKVVGSGRDTLIYKYTPTIAQDELEHTFFSLQAEYRSLQAEFNGMLHEIDESIKAFNLKESERYASEKQAYLDARSKYNDKISIARQKEADRIGKLRIVIPNSLLATYDLINGLGK